MYPAACTKFQPKQMIRYKFLKGEFSKRNQSWSKNDKKLEQKHIQRSGTGLSQTGRRFPLSIFVAKDNFS